MSTRRKQTDSAARATTIQDVANAAILAGKTNDEALAAVLAAFPRSGANSRTISWYRSQLRGRGHDVPKDREVRNFRTPRRVSASADNSRQDDLALVQSILEVLGAGGEPAQKLRYAIIAALSGPKKKTLIDIFASDLPDEVFEGVFPEDRQSGWREFDL